MKRFLISLFISFMTIMSVSSCGVASLALSATSLALNTASLVGHSALLAHDLTTYVGDHKTAYTFELVSMTNDGGIMGGEILYPTADNQYKAEFKDDLIDFTFCFKYNCIAPAFKSQTNTYITINWNDIVLDGSQKLLWKDGNSSMSTLTRAGFNEAYLYVIFDKVSRTYRTLPVYVSQKKADEANLVGQTFTLAFRIINVDKVITYTATIKIADITVS